MSDDAAEPTPIESTRAERPDLRTLSLSALPVIAHTEDNHMYRLDTMWLLRPEIIERIALVRERLNGLVVDEYMGAALLTLGAITVEQLVRLTRAFDDAPSKSIH